MRKIILLFSVILANLVKVNNGNYYQQKANLSDCIKKNRKEIENSISQRFKNSRNFDVIYNCVPC